MVYDEDGNRSVRKLLGVGFALMILLLAADGLGGFLSVRSIKATASALAQEESTQIELVDELEHEQGSLNAIFYLLAAGPDAENPVEMRDQIDDAEARIRAIFARVDAHDPQRQVWEHLESAVEGFCTEARRVLSLPRGKPHKSRELFRTHQEIVTAVAQLIGVRQSRSRDVKEQIEDLADSQTWEDLVLLGASILLASLCVFLVLRNSSKLYSKMAQQSDELTRCSWHLLENQEVLARRLSHELHDELGQSLTALKISLTRHASAPCIDGVWLHDCTELLKESIRSVHEISLLLRPTILDDFGLDSGLNWLCDRFADRSGIQVDYSSTFKGRLLDESETHLFRIAQEGLTNVARHSGASQVKIELREDHDRVVLLITDNGKGLPSREEIRKEALGLTGMRARARSSKGELTIHSKPKQCVSIQVWVPRGQKE